MASDQYTFHFQDINYRLGQVDLCVGQDAQKRALRIAIVDNQLAVRSMRQMSALQADLVDLATAICITDRFCVRGNDVCTIHVTLPLRCPQIFQQPAIVDQLNDILWWFTGDHWHFEFGQRHLHPRPAEIQTCISFRESEERPVEVALWSGGLDSGAGLYNRAIASPDTQFILFGTGINPTVRHEQSKTAQAAAERFPKRIRLIQMPIILRDTHELPKNREQRSRGFVFMLLGAVCAIMEGQNVLNLYENGVGAINLRYRASEVGQDHSVAVNPLSLYRVMDFVSAVFEMPFAIQNPFVFWTKGQMCEVLHNEHTLINATASCDRRHRQPQLPSQCGCCSSCLLRRQALMINGLTENTVYVVPHGRTPRPSDRLHLEAMLSQVSTMRMSLRMNDIWKSLSGKYPILIAIAEEMSKRETCHLSTIQQQLIDLYSTYVTEWDQTAPVLKSVLLFGKTSPRNIVSTPVLK